MSYTKDLAAAAALFISFGANTALMADTPCSGVLTGAFENVTVPSGATCELKNARVDGNVIVEPGGAVTLSDRTYVHGSVQSDGGRYVRLLGAGVAVGGDVQIKRASEASGMLRGTLVLGNFQYVENTGYLFAFRSFVDGSLQMFSNSGGAVIAGNVIRENLQCKENTPPPTGSYNTVGGNKEDQCAGF
jgi:hypothetical protein